MHRYLSIAATLLCVFALPGYAAEAGSQQADACWHKAFLASNADATAACYAADAVMWAPGGTMTTGNKAIRDSYAKFFADNKVTNVELKPMGDKTVGEDSVGWGTYSITYTPRAGGAAKTENGRYTDIARKVGGHWVYTVDHASDDPAPTSAKP
ncbi:YybH family protein [Dyella silvae]|uniref:YybH family protein n=1 Tax=Dyella silvae TaxID=2994424 RepID=UPI002264112B|nr:nuclear transport factor 2 family protein [Dyella silvae]